MVVAVVVADASVAIVEVGSIKRKEKKNSLTTKIIFNLVQK